MNNNDNKKKRKAFALEMPIFSHSWEYPKLLMAWLEENDYDFYRACYNAEYERQMQKEEEDYKRLQIEIAQELNSFQSDLHQ